MKTVGELLADPTSNLSKNVAKAERAKADYMAEVDKLVAQGHSHEEAWRKVLFG